MTADGMFVLHWNEAAGTWDGIPWTVWTEFRLGKEYAPLPGVDAGDNYFVMGELNHQGDIVWLRPQRCTIYDDGELRAVFDSLTADERTELRQLEDIHNLEGSSREVRTLMADERRRLKVLQDKAWPSLWPSLRSIPALIPALPKIPGANSNAWRFLNAIGVTAESGSWGLAAANLAELLARRANRA
jgi:hypothetical protein